MLSMKDEGSELPVQMIAGIASRHGAGDVALASVSGSCRALRAELTEAVGSRQVLRAAEAAGARYVAMLALSERFIALPFEQREYYYNNDNGPSGTMSWHRIDTSMPISSIPILCPSFPLPKPSAEANALVRGWFELLMPGDCVRNGVGDVYEVCEKSIHGLHQVAQVSGHIRYALPAPVLPPPRTDVVLTSRCEE